MTDSVRRAKVFAEAAGCLRALAQVRTSSARILVKGPASESMAVKLVELAAKLDHGKSVGIVHKFTASERALLMEALSAMAPLIDHAHALDVSPREMADRRKCAENFQSAIDLIGASAT